MILLGTKAKLAKSPVMPELVWKRRISSYPTSNYNSHSKRNPKKMVRH